MRRDGAKGAALQNAVHLVKDGAKPAVVIVLLITETDHIRKISQGKKLCAGKNA